MTTDLERPNRFPWPPVLYAIAILAAIAAQVAYPLGIGWIPHPFSDLLFATGGVVILAALALDLSAMATLHRARTTIWPNRRSDHLVASGPYKVSRNPIYLGNTLLLIGVGLVSGIAWFILFAFAAAFATQKLAIEREERHLAHRFGKPYRDYMKKVRRWF
ncbi:isoprenylcysteine carboxyl methyltransferase [Zhengella mangrovi]|uniref:Isoprenylcysteine carboxyl methyltransferase n=1 Tax=Zhengella mangrovi TaxID=1982044 RepID=A0A2G1QHU2_9HYPH|nr:isoprenylcysteine carboxylmethyltransferase family protein [Zhengella mangrovi]PHP65049.1 isoprenylcysteine carboxyl methyltransferase [Zhengella mangrovi]